MVGNSLKTVDNPAEIRQVGQVILYGDETSITMVYKNMIGVNIKGREYRNYKKYLQCQGVSLDLPVQLWVGGQMMEQDNIR